METSALQSVYESHHATRRGRGYVVFGDARGAFLQKEIGIGKHVLDVGCRDGALTGRYAKGNTVLGLDIDASALAYAKETLGIATKYVDLNGAWGIEPKSFDCVVAAEVIEHLYYPGVVIKKAADALTKNGVLVGTVPNAFSLANRSRYIRAQKRGTPLSDPTHINHFTVSELRAMLEAHFADVTIDGYGRFAKLAHWFPQWFAFDLFFTARHPRA